MDAEGMQSKVARLSKCLEDTLAYCTVEEFVAGFKKSLAFQTCVMRHAALQVE